MIGCDCVVCRSEDPRDKRTRSSILVQSPECRWVVDTGPDFRAQCLREGISHLDAVLYTHGHTDHVMGFDDLRRFCEFHKEGLPIHASPSTMEDLRRVFAFAFSGENRVPGYVIPKPTLIEGPFFLEETRIDPLPVPHGRTMVTGFLFSRSGEKCLAYLSDCNAVPEPVLEQIAGVRVLIIDALRHRPHPTHLHIAAALDVAEKTDPGAVWFTHMCHDISHAMVEKELPPGVRLAYDGLRIEA